MSRIASLPCRSQAEAGRCWCKGGRELCWCCSGRLLCPWRVLRSFGWRNFVSLFVRRTYNCGMNESTDAELLARFAQSESEGAFAALVRRHVHLVHSVALRHTANAHQAEEITQAVFVIL